MRTDRWKNINKVVTIFLLGDIIGYTYSTWEDFIKHRKVNGSSVHEVVTPGKIALELQEYGALKVATMMGKEMKIHGNIYTSVEALKEIKKRTEFKKVKGRRDEASVYHKA
ncbi:MAG: hypothetical protein KAS32_17215 [Candidatus Peribacteraceae bacterium]|nr:hypothetical protein [Candidatus Peribacteraceae bacterium]